MKVTRTPDQFPAYQFTAGANPRQVWLGRERGHVRGAGVDGNNIEVAAYYHDLRYHLGQRLWFTVEGQQIEVEA